MCVCVFVCACVCVCVCVCVIGFEKSCLTCKIIIKYLEIHANINKVLYFMKESCEMSTCNSPRIYSLSMYTPTAECIRI